MILVAGASGRLGRTICAQLRAGGLPVREMVRSGSRPDAVIADVRDRGSLDAALVGVDVVVSAVTGFAAGRHGVSDVDRDGNVALIEAAADAGVCRFVLLSTNAPTSDHPMQLARMKLAAEQALRASTLTWTIIRPTVFYETWAEICGRSLGKHKAVLLGRGDNPVNFVSVRDVADVVQRAVSGALDGMTVGVGGERDLTLREFVNVLDPDVVVRTIPLPVVRTLRFLLRGPAPFPARILDAAIAMDTIDMRLDTAVDEVVIGHHRPCETAVAS